MRTLARIAPQMIIHLILGTMKTQWIAFAQVKCERVLLRRVSCYILFQVNVELTYEDIVPWSDHNKVKHLEESNRLETAKLEMRSKFNETLIVQQGILSLVQQNTRFIRY